MVLMQYEVTMSQKAGYMSLMVYEVPLLFNETTTVKDTKKQPAQKNMVMEYFS